METKTIEKDSGLTSAKLGFWQAILVTLITALAGIVTGYLGIPHKIDPLQKQGVENINMEGKWKYICTSFDGTYQHGGRFIIQKDDHGALIISGERMWKDIKDSTGWKNKNFAESDYLHWRTNWIFVKDEVELYFQYSIELKDKVTIGYCSGIINSEEHVVQSVKGTFYVLNENPILTGQIIFKRVSDSEYNSTSTLVKNH